MHLLATIQYPHFNQVAFRLGPLSVRWYGLMYLLGFLFCYVVLREMIRRGVLRLTFDALSDLIGWLIMGVFLGGRLGWWVFYHHNIPGKEPWYEPIAVWHGGMSFHGGLIGVALVMILWSRWRKAPLWNIADCATLVAPIGLFLGRIGNFINAELVGRPTSLPWGIIFPEHPLPRHPSQLYEALLEGPILLAALWAARRIMHPRDGQISALFIILYGLFRFLVEFTRQPDAQLGYIALGWLTMGQALSIFILLIGLAMWVALGRRDPHIAA